MNQRTWTPEEDEYIKNNFENIPTSEIAKKLGCAIATVQNRAKQLGFVLEKKTVDRWTTEEEKLLREYSKKYVTKTIAKKLGRSYISVQKKAVKLGIELHSEKDPWKKWMVDYLKDNINKRPIGEIQNMLGLSYHRILTKCKELGIEYKKESWTDEEIATLREYAGKCHYTELTKVLPNRSVGAITAKAYELGIETISEYTKLTDENIQYIKDNWGKIPVTEIARNLKVSTGVIYRYKKQLGLPNVGQQIKWTDDVIEKIRKDAKIKNRNELAKKYNTSPEQISTIAKRNNIILIDSKKTWTDELDKKLIELVEQELNVTQISAQMHLKASSIRQRMKQLGIYENKPKNSNIKKWTEEEINILKTLSTEKTSYEIAEILNKTERQVYEKAKKLGITLNRDKNNLWTEDDTKTLIDIHDKYELHIIAQVMDRAEYTIRQKANELGLSLKFKERSNWTPEETEKLVAYAEEFTIKEIANLLNRSTSSVSSKLKYMGISAQNSQKFWTEEEEKKLIALSQDYDVNEIAILMNKSYESIISKLYGLGLKAKNKSNRPWTEEESELLLELLTTYSSFEVAQILGRSEEAIMVRAIKIGYNIDYRHRRWTPEEETMLSDLWGSVPIEKIAKKLNRTSSAVINRVFMLGLGSQIENNYDGIRIQELANMFSVNRNTILTSWVSLGLKLDFRKRSNNSVYSFVQISNLYEFLEKYQDLWDSRLLEKNILGIEPVWLQEKRKRDQGLSSDAFGLDNLNKQQLLQAKRYFLNLERSLLEQSIHSTEEFPLEKHIEKGKPHRLVKIKYPAEEKRFRINQNGGKKNG